MEFAFIIRAFSQKNLGRAKGSVKTSFQINLSIQ